jgi:hypothetical protein
MVVREERSDLGGGLGTSSAVGVEVYRNLLGWLAVGTFGWKDKACLLMLVYQVVFGFPHQLVPPLSRIAFPDRVERQVERHYVAPNRVRNIRAINRRGELALAFVQLLLDIHGVHSFCHFTDTLWSDNTMNADEP